MKYRYIVILLLVSIFSCSKKTDCDNAKLCVENTGNDTINYC